MVISTSVYGGAQETQSGFPVGAGLGRCGGGRRCGSSWTRFVDVPVFVVVGYCGGSTVAVRGGRAGLLTSLSLQPIPRSWG